MRIGDRDIPIHRGWIVEYRDGKVLCEADFPWKKLPNKQEIRRVILRWDDRWWSFEDKENYVPPSKREVINITQGGISSGGIHSRTIGYYDSDCKVILRVDEATGKATYETIDY
jgi:hypothetical protein